MKQRIVMGIRNRKELRAQYDAAERRKEDEEEDVEGDEEESDEADDEIEAGADDEGDEGEDGDDEEAPVVKKKKKVVKEVKPKRSRSAKVVRMKVVWGVFNNSNQCVAKFEYPKRKEAEEHAAKLAAAKNPPQPFFIQPVKEAMEDK
jgi:hypothetical protein